MRLTISSVNNPYKCPINCAVGHFCPVQSPAQIPWFFNQLNLVKSEIIKMKEPKDYVNHAKEVHHFFYFRILL
jgi:hypothetical protein